MRPLAVFEDSVILTTIGSITVEIAMFCGSERWPNSLPERLYSAQIYISSECWTQKNVTHRSCNPCDLLESHYAFAKHLPALEM
jgi:hypothetical protein